MGDMENLAVKLEAFMEQMATRQRALEEQMAELSITVRRPEKGSNGNGGGNGGSSGSSDDRSDSQSKGSMAQLWFDQMEQEETELNWGRFKEYCHVRFGPPMSNNPLGELANLKQMGSVEEYQRQFQSLLSRTSDLKPHQQVDLFTVGLVEELRIDIEMQQPGNLGIAMNMARALERKQRVSQGTPTSRTSMSWPSSKNTSNSSVISANRNSNARGGGQTAKPVGSSSRVGSSAPFVKRLTRAEMAERRAKGLCYNCGESYSTGHKCNRLFWIEVPDDESESEEDMAISLHAISGVRESHTMQLQAKVSGVNVLVLVDSGSTHNFLHEGLIPSLGLEVLKRSGLQVYVANGERVPSMGICRSVSFMVANDIFQADFYTIPLEGFDVILGVKWLCTLGPILWDFSYMTMVFVINGKEAMWRGQGPEVAPQLSLMHAIHDMAHEGRLKTLQRLRKDFHWKDLPPVCDGKALPTPQAILRSRLNRGHQELLVHWTGCPKEDATWEPVARFQEAYPEFELEDKLKAEEGSDDTDAFVGQKYQRRKTATINAV
ncbi:Retrotransposon gag domain [Sesbania bispinosa]|nr:Retrotransposon gag domain [Sesbania bispinosa]